MAEVWYPVRHDSHFSGRFAGRCFITAITSETSDNTREAIDKYRDQAKCPPRHRSSA